jgi:large conductance mechanosensitive channel
MKMLKEFKEFAMRGNVVDMAVGLVIGAAFGKIVSSLVADVIMPLVGMVVGNVDFRTLTLSFGEGGAVVAYGNFLQHVVDFVIVAFAIFLVVKLMNRLKRKEETAAEPVVKDCPKCCSSIPIKATRCPQCTSEL